MPKLSVIMPSLNVASYIAECIESVCKQTLFDIEILCIDAGSDDGTYEILTEYKARDSRIRLIRSKVKSYGYQVNLGIKEARGEYIAIVETDDYIKPEMFNILVSLAEENDLDIAKSNFTFFFDLKNGDRVFRKSYNFEPNSEIYNKIISTSDNFLYLTYDANIWKGVYRKSFLIENKIKLSETPGAAYQDIGFVFLTLMCAKRIMYIEESLYMYRMDREDASSYSVKALSNSKYEYKRLMDLIGNSASYNDKKALYYKMAVSFRDEYDKVLVKEKYDYNSKFLTENIKWFKKELKNAQILGFFDKNDYDEQWWSETELIFNNPSQYAMELQEKKEVRRRIIDELKSSNVIVFGAGRRGAYIVGVLLQNGVDILRLVDNCKGKYGTKLQGIEITSIQACIKEMPDAYYVVANKKYENDICEQLLEMGLCTHKIVKGSILVS